MLTSLQSVTLVKLSSVINVLQQRYNSLQHVRYSLNSSANIIKWLPYRSILSLPVTLNTNCGVNNLSAVSQLIGNHLYPLLRYTPSKTSLAVYVYIRMTVWWKVGLTVESSVSQAIV